MRLHRLPRQRQNFVAIKLVMMSRCFDFLELIADQTERFGTRGFELVLRAFEISPGLGYCRGIFSWIEKWQADRNADVELTHCLARFGLRRQYIGLARVAKFVALAVYFGELIEQVDVGLVYFKLCIFVPQPMKGCAGARESIELGPAKILEGCAGFGRHCSCPAQIFP